MEPPCSPDVRIVDPELLQTINESLSIIDQALDRYKLEEVALSFNGGKDCCVLLQLLYTAITKRGYDIGKLKVLYFSIRDSFGEVDKFVEECSQIYGVTTIILEPLNQHILQSIIDSYQLKAIFMGTRSTDPRASTLMPFSPTDKGWPSFMRVNPILHWNYGDVWKFIRVQKVPYCTLYDAGYTSLGAKVDTIPNPALKTSHGTYDPAYMLSDFSKERAGRMSG
eukprot:TRINITY_DN19826_c0_g1_i1.p1 TRINITY_DN19826_c0_g1~~TRINITY_DN19826_c0_g1_i1.p1  ORF type:complete len:224 (-),score=-3.11 TRINITY_DN19826_c0_g1_i1:118-789(-)